MGGLARPTNIKKTGYENQFFVVASARLAIMQLLLLLFQVF